MALNFIRTVVQLLIRLERYITLLAWDAGECYTPECRKSVDRVHT